ncbi:MAG TPA: TatD family hydrolase [Smithellaceae bacterium]|jgi:TatD DNase family protein|nr:TatD family hydrolase [Syntrophaceae bacterium]MDX9815569.1 TatD family hydrolase [Smithellaceae bacterium]NMD05838.1 TatD family hydrolase [Deltaproteobacteria bacterium]MBP8609385.1 TatD family hydrolase [Syntrophaceae bacterium]HOD31433.1 TatD family hydrolase [Smithellaceae bacterium]
MLIDSHAHLEMEQFDNDRQEVIERACLAGVEYIITVGTNPAFGEKAISIAKQYKNIFVSLGIHPHEAATADDKSLAQMADFARQPEVVAYGEIGLDFFRNLSPREKQIEVFSRQLEIARDLSLPVVIHDRDAHEQVLQLVRSSGVQRGVFHCFSGDYALAQKCLDLGFYLSIPGTVTFDKAVKISDVVKKVPLEFLLLETDCPFLTPVPYRGRRNEPSFIIHTAKKVAQIKSLRWEDVADTTTRNALNLFRLKK